MWAALKAYTRVYLSDFEFSGGPGERPKPVCCVIRELHSGQQITLWEEDLRRYRQAPFALSRDALYVAFSAEAELGCHLALGWQLPTNVLCLHAEFRNTTNGLLSPKGDSLINALKYYRLPSIESTHKDVMRERILAGGPWTLQERDDILHYCEEDVNALQRLLAKLLPALSLDEALLRGRYVRAVACMEHNGIPLDLSLRQALMQQWEPIQHALITAINPTIGYAFDTEDVLKRDRLFDWATAQHIRWPVTRKTRQPRLDEDTLKNLALLYPELEPFRQLQKTLGQMRLAKMVVGSDGRNRPGLQPFRSITGRNQPKSSENILGAAAWLRSLIQPEPWNGMAYIDWNQQEFGIVAVLSKDPAMLRGYESGDPYVAFGRAIGMIPAWGDKTTHNAAREICKICMLGVLYGMTDRTLARRIGKAPHVGARLMREHQRTYRTFWNWAKGTIERAKGTREISTVFGWHLYWPYHQPVDCKPISPRTIRNFVAQANGAELLRLATAFAIEAGVRVCAPLHDAILIEAPLADFQEAVWRTQRAMQKASDIVLDGFHLRTEPHLFLYPEHYEDKRGISMWNTVRPLLGDVHEKSLVRA